MIRASWMIYLVTIAANVAAVNADDEQFPGKFWHKAESPEDAGWNSALLATAQDFSATLDTAALMIVYDGVVVDEWGAVALPLKCHSVRKSLLSAMYGPHVANGTIDLDRTLAELGIDDKEPSLSDQEKQARVRDLLKARSGVYHPALYETAAMAAARPPRGSHKADTLWYYNNWDFNANATIFENLTGRSLFEEFEHRLAIPLQMQDFVRARHTRYVTGDDSVHPAYPFELSTRDLARFGLLFIHKGRWNDQQIVPANWVAESTRSYSDAGASGGYGYMWWVAVDGEHFPGVSLPEGSFSARGYRGQYLLVIPEWNIVIAHRVNSFQEGTRVAKADFGELLAMILAARPTAKTQTTSKGTRNDAREPLFDVLLANGEVIDGSGNASIRADVGIRNGRIAKIGDLRNLSAARVVDVVGKIVAPGFIDLHSHAEHGLTSSDPLRRAAPNLITQGITTVVVNQDGGGPDSIREQRRIMQKLGVGPNVVQMVGHGNVRHQVMRDDYRRTATDDEIQQMRKLVRRGMEEGARGMSAGLEYDPGRWSNAKEMQALVGELVPREGVYVLHERSSGSHPMWFLPSRDKANPPSMIDNINELIQLAEATNVTVVATHIKARGVDFWGSSRIMIDMIEKARARGLNVFADQYAYNTSGSDGRIVLIPDWVGDEQDEAEMTPAEHLERVLGNRLNAADVRRDIAFEITRRGGPDNILILEHPQSSYVGKSLAELAVELKFDPVEVAIQLQLRGDRKRRGGVRVRAFSMSERDVEAFAATPWTATSSDAGITLPEDGPVHPRFYGAFPRKIRRYAIDRQLMSIEEAVRVSTSLPAQILKLGKRGTIVVDAPADIVVFDPRTIRDTADAFNPHQYCEGIDHVFVGGQPVVENGRYLGTLAGSVLGRDGASLFGG
ncbi:MAG: amidohydrolase family protein [Planctomycetes bacterium]|nr:amidohydrolase family protein [Planctomycetota bacterium]